MADLPLWVTATGLGEGGVADDARYVAGMKRRLRALPGIFSRVGFRRGPVFWFNLRGDPAGPPTGLLDSRMGVRRATFTAFVWEAEAFPPPEAGP